MAKRFSDDVERAIANAALRTGLEPGMIRAFVAIESGGRTKPLTTEELTQMLKNARRG